NLGHVPEVHGGAVHNAQGQVVQLGKHAWTGIEPHLIIAVTDFGAAGGGDQVLAADHGADVGGGGGFWVKQDGVEVDHYLAKPATIGQGHACAADGGELGTDEILAQVEDFLLAQRVALQAELENGHGGHVVLDDAGRENSRRHRAQHGLRHRNDL